MHKLNETCWDLCVGSMSSSLSGGNKNKYTFVPSISYNFTKKIDKYKVLIFHLIITNVLNKAHIKTINYFSFYLRGAGGPDSKRSRGF